MGFEVGSVSLSRSEKKAHVEGCWFQRASPEGKSVRCFRSVYLLHPVRTYLPTQYLPSDARPRNSETPISRPSDAITAILR